MSRAQLRHPTDRAAAIGAMTPVTAPSGTPVAKTITQINEELQAWADDQPMLAKCGHCDWSFQGSAARARERFDAHRREEHPELLNGRAKRERFRSFGEQAIQARDRRRAAQVGDVENPREEPSVATFDCKITGCEERAKANRGRFAYLCDTHKAEKLQAAPPPAKRPKPARNGTVTKTRMELLRELIAKQQEIDELESRLQDQHAQFEAIAELFAKARS